MNKEFIMSLIMINSLVKEYNGASDVVRACDKISCTIEKSEFIAVMGPSGSGKSTLLSIMGGLNHPTNGEVIIDGLDIYSLAIEQLADFRREYIGFVFQSFQLIPYLTVLENVMLPLAVTDYSNKQQMEISAEILNRVGLYDKMHRLPNQLSGGEQERVAIARCLINRPPIVLADEPTGNLDSLTGIEIMELFQSLNAEGQTVIMVTHNPENAEFAGRIIQLKDGKIAA